MSALKYLLVKEYKQMFRNVLLPVVFIVVPVMLMNVVPRIATQEVTNINVAVVDADRSTLSERLVQKLAASRYFHLYAAPDDYDAAYDLVLRGDADIVLTIEQDFERNLLRSGTANVAVDANAVNGMRGMLGSSYLTQIVMTYAAELAAERGTAQNAPVAVKPRHLYNTTLEYKPYMIPALMVMSLVLLVGFLPALNIVGEKERGTMEQINVTPVSRTEFILSKMIPYWSVGLFIVVVSMLMAWAIHGVTPTGSVWLILLFNIVGTLTISSLALTVSNYSDSIRQAAMTMFFFIILFLLSSGLLSPVSSMPEWAQEVTRINPLRYLMAAMRDIYLKGSTFTQLLPQFVPLCIYGLVAGVCAVMSYRKKE